VKLVAIGLGQLDRDVDHSTWHSTWHSSSALGHDLHRGEPAELVDLGLRALERRRRVAIAGRERQARTRGVGQVR
jgi:hypothetical protein